MAERLLRYYKHVSDTKGMAAKIALAQETQCPSSKAAMEPDSAENIQRFKRAVEKITGKAAPEF